MSRGAKDEAQRVIQLLAAAPDGLTQSQLVAATGLSVRTLQRRLSELIASNQIRHQGPLRSRRYLSPRAGELQAHELGVSARGQQVRALIRRPVGARTPVGYRSAFLESYRPNEEHYLPATTRAHLRTIGETPGGDRPAGTYARDILGRLLIDLAWASSRLEGNTYSRLDTQNLIELGRQAPGKDQREAQMILNHKSAIEMLVSSVDDVGFNRYTICNLHALLADNLLVDQSALGRVRRIDVGITGTTFHPLAIPQRLEELFDILLAKTEAIRDPFEQAFFVMVQLPYLQPFEDVNKRVSRIAANIPFIKQNLAPLSFVDVPDRDYVDGTLGVYELNDVALLRDVYVWAYERSCQRYSVVRDSLPQPDPVRLRNREQLVEIVSAIVRDDLPIDVARIRALIPVSTTSDDVEAVIAMAIHELHNLDENNLARFRLRPSELSRWRGRR